MKYDKKTLQGTLMYVQVKEPRDFEGDERPRFRVTVVMTDEDYADDVKAHFAEVKCKKVFKETKTTDFIEANGFKPENAGKKVWSVTLTTDAFIGVDKKPIPGIYRPRVVIKDTETGMLTDVTETILVGNGSTGVVVLNPFLKKDGTTVFNFTRVLVRNLIEYVPQNQLSSDDDLLSYFEEESQGVQPDEPNIPEEAEVKVESKAKSNKKSPW